MKKSFVLVIAMISLFYYSEKANAGFLVEPYLGTYLSSTYEGDSNAEGDLTGTAVGARVGFQNLGLMLGLDGRRHTWTSDPDDGTDGSELSGTSLGLFVGYDFPILLRVWAEYIFSNTLDETDGDEDEYYEGGGTLFGLGYKVLPFVSVNLEMGTFTTSKAKDGTTGTEFDFDLENKTYLLSVSFPISI